MDKAGKNGIHSIILALAFWRRALDDESSEGKDVKELLDAADFKLFANHIIWVLRTLTSNAKAQKRKAEEGDEVGVAATPPPPPKRRQMGKRTIVQPQRGGASSSPRKRTRAR